MSDVSKCAEMHVITNTYILYACVGVVLVLATMAIGLFTFYSVLNRNFSFGQVIIITTILATVWVLFIYSYYM